MSVFGPNQTGNFLSGAVYSSEDNIEDFLENAVAREIRIISGEGGDVSVPTPFKVVQKSNVAAGGIEFSEIINPNNINSITTKAYTAPVARVLTVTGFTGTVRNNCTYEIFIRLMNDGGTLSPENFRMIPAFYVTPADASAVTFTTVLNALKEQLEKTLARESNTLFTIAVDTGAGELSITAGNREFVLGKKDGKPVEFSLQAAVRDNGSTSVTSGNFYEDLTVETTTAGNPGSGTYNQVASLEWFYKGNSYSRYRDVAYPVNFATPYEIDPSKTYHIIAISYFSERSYTQVEKQHRVLYIAIENADQDGAGAGTAFTAVNAFINDLEIVTGLTIADLA